MRQVFRERRPIPKKFAEAPEVPLGLELYLDAFWELTTCRQVGYGVIGPIPWGVMLDYAVAQELDLDQRDDLVYYVRSLDAAYMQHRAQEAKRNSGGQS